MTTAKRQRFVTGVTAWLVGTILLLSLLGSMELELFFVVSLIGVLVVVELTAPFNVTPRWRRRLIPLIVVGLLGFGIIVVRRILAILPEGLF